MSLATRVTRAWQHKSPLLMLLWPLSLLYRCVIAARGLAYQCGWLQSYKADVPVVVVGNITVGGTGKSPLVAALVKQFQSQGMQPGVVSRGYGAQTRHVQPWQVSAGDDASQVGDEPAMLAGQVSCPIVVCTDRMLAIATLQEQGCDVVIADDGMQHYRMQRDVEICVVDGKRWWGNGFLLPVGPMREPLQRLQKVDCLVVNGSNGATPPQGSLDGVSVFNMTLQSQDLIPLNQSASRAVVRPPEPPARVHGVAGIGHPQRFFDTLTQLGYEVIPHAKADHHCFKETDFAFREALPVVMTAKDAVKCRNLYLENAWVLPVEAELNTDFYAFLQTRILECRVHKHHEKS